MTLTDYFIYHATNCTLHVQKGTCGQALVQ